MRQRIWRSAVAAVTAAVLVIGVDQAAPAAAQVVAAGTSVTIAGDLGHLIPGCGDWQPGCTAAHLAQRPDGVFSGTFQLPAGSYNYKAALDDSWAVSYGAGGGSANVPLKVPAGGAAVTFYFDPTSHWLTDNIGSHIVTAVGNFQTALGCSSNSDPNCLKSWLEDLTGSGVYTLSTGAIPAGNYTVSAADGLAAGTNYGAGGAAGGAAINFTVPSGGGGATTTFTYSATTHVITVKAVALVQGPPVSFGSPTSRRGDVVANLFEWNWHSVATECVRVLGPAGYGGVQVAPPQDSLTKTDGPVHPWWEVYQPIDYNLTSRMGNEAQFKQMVATCRKAGVKVYVDAVINHMSGQGNLSYGGVTYSKYNYPGLYNTSNFHHFPADCPQPDGTIHDFNNYLEVTKCELVGLADLRTDSNYVRNQIAGYLNKLLGDGVSGFRVDAAKHIGQVDLAAIEAKLRKTVDGTKPYVALEVPTGGPGKLAPQAFKGQGSLLGFDFAAQILQTFTSNITDLSVFGEAAGLLPSNKSLAFVENHDTERNGSTLSYKSGPTNTLANEFMLAYGYGKPEVYASFTWSTSDDSPPSNAKGYVSNTNCDTGWACTDRSIGVANLVDFHNYAQGAPVANWYDDSVNMIAFSRGTKAWIAINNHITPQTHTFSTGLRKGTYCDVIHGTFSSYRGFGSCSGATVTVDSRGRATVTVPAKDSVAFDAADLVTAITPYRLTTKS